MLYDGNCGLCSSAVQWILARDHQGLIHFAALESPLGQAIQQRHPELPAGIDSVLFVETDDRSGQEAVSWRSRAIFRLAVHLPRPWRFLAWGSLFPAPLTDLGYRLVARFRYAIWGRADQCRVPTATERQRFLA